MWFTKYLNCDDDILSERICAVGGGQSLSYGELCRQAKNVAFCLTHLHGVENGDIVGVMMDPGINFLITLHGIWLSGCAFLVLDASLPRERLKYMLLDSQIKTIATETSYIVDISLLESFCDLELLRTFVFSESISTNMGKSENFSFAKHKLLYSSISYVKYTSGSTGIPKGVLCTHGGLKNLCVSLTARIDINPDSVVIQFANTSFDASVREIFCTLFAKGKLVMGNREEKMPGKDLADLIVKENVTHICLPPTILGTLKEYSENLGCLKNIVMAGEPCPSNLAKIWMRDGRRIFNEYGPTEATVCSTVYEILETDEVIPIGKPLDGVNVYILNEYGQECPKGAPGELAIGGKGVANGYINKPELNSQKFFSLPTKNDFCFLSGDQVVERNGNLYFLGRLDRQIKLRGLRIELEAIENIIYKHPSIKACAVKVVSSICEDDTEKKYLVAYVSLVKNESKMCEKELKQFIANYLPSYMVPSTSIVFLDSLPMMHNNSKIDRDALLIPDAITKAKNSNKTNFSHLELAKNPLHRMCWIFESVLNLTLNSVQPSDDFFNLGGDSLKVNCILRLVEKFMNVALPAWAIYGNSSPRDLLKFCDKYRISSNNCEHTSDESDLYVEFNLNDSNVVPIEPQVPNVENIILLFTGATGFLGAHLLSTILSNSRLSKIYCLIRSESDEHAMKRLRDTFSKYLLGGLNESVIAFSGDISEEYLGMNRDRYTKLVLSVNVVINAAADISYIKPYSQIYKPNVLGTKNLLAFSTAMGKVKTLHHISSLSIFGAEYTLLGIKEIDENYDIEKVRNILQFESGYVRAKWAAEHLLLKARDKFRLPVNIYRPGFISGHFVNGISNTSDLLCRMMMGCLQMGSFPDFPNMYWTALPVDSVAKAIANIFFDNVVGKNFHIAPERSREPSHNDLFGFVSSSGGGLLQKLPAEQWLKELSTVDENNHLFPLVRYLTSKFYHGKRTTLEIHHRTAIIRCNHTLRAMDNVEMQFPDVDKTVVQRYLNYFKSQLLI